jgi:predicted RNase H-like nuclease (RuvC/YqgF family)
MLKKELEKKVHEQAYQINRLCAVRDGHRATIVALNATVSELKCQSNNAQAQHDRIYHMSNEMHDMRDQINNLEDGFDRLNKFVYLRMDMLPGEGFEEERRFLMALLENTQA